ncbi:MAG: DUF2306 domain-containing protein [Vicinamibacterales bacterium]
MTCIHRTRRTRQTLRILLVPASLLALGIVPVVAGLVRLAGLMTGQASADAARFFEDPLPVALHILAVIPYSLLGALQFAPALRRRGWHRAVGVALVPLGLVAALTGLWMAQFYAWPKGDGEAVYFMRLIVGVAMTFAIVRGVASLWHHEYVAHGAWMLRGYALGMGAGTQVLTHLPWFVFVGGTPGEANRAVMMGLAWIINAIVAEYVIRTRLAAPAGVTSDQPHSVLVSPV